jgi:ABC-type polysaccharide/polyol phosphate transport system ATPase subunit
MAALEFDHISKHYRGARRSYRMLRDDLKALLPGRPSESNGSIRALDDVSFAVGEGEAFAVIGQNGAGKTTALKLASRIAFPTKGKLRVRGRVGALIEVSTGLHPELTGRENMQLYGRILGFKKSDIRSRFDDIVEFSEVGHALDQPVKQYSSGMQLRLGFALAAHLEPDVLLVDEAIAVGDLGFQYRCVERMRELVHAGCTLVFVSHDMSAVETLCDRAIWLRDGRLVATGTARSVVHDYLRWVQALRLEADRAGNEPVGDRLVISRVSLHDARGAEITSLRAGETLTVRFHYRAFEPILQPSFSVGMSDGRHFFTLASMLIDGETPDVLEGEGHVDCVFEGLPLFPRTYELWGSVRGQGGFGDLVDWQRLRLFEITDEITGAGSSAVTHSLLTAPVRLPYSWRVGNGPGEPDSQ